MKRRTLIRLLIVVGIGIPILVEAGTLLGLVGVDLFGDDSGRPPNDSTPTRDPVGVGVELLPETPQTETVTRAIVEVDDEEWWLFLTVSVSNDATDEYELRLGPVTTADGRTVSGTVSTGTLQANKSAELRGSWLLPSGSTPETVIAVARSGHDGTPSTVIEEVRLADVPVRNR